MEVVVMARRWGRRGRWQAWRWRSGWRHRWRRRRCEMVVEEGRACELAHIRCEFASSQFGHGAMPFLRPKFNFHQRARDIQHHLYLGLFELGSF